MVHITKHSSLFALTVIYILEKKLQSPSFGRTPLEYYAKSEW